MTVSRTISSMLAAAACVSIIGVAAPAQARPEPKVEVTKVVEDNDPDGRMWMKVTVKYSCAKGEAGSVSVLVHDDGDSFETGGSQASGETKGLTCDGKPQTLVVRASGGIDEAGVATATLHRPGSEDFVVGSKEFAVKV